MMQKDIFIRAENTVKDALRKLDKTADKVLLVIDRESSLIGTITDGDIRRYILKGKSLEENIEKVYNRNPVCLYKNDFSVKKAKKALLDNQVELIPVINHKKRVIDFITWNQAFSENQRHFLRKGRICIPVVIMCGGRGTRLEPISKILPKALVPVGDTPIAEIIIAEFKKFGINKFYLTLNHKGKMIESYFDSIQKDYELHFVWDSKTSGTAGGLKALKRKIKGNFLVSNCDVIVKANFEDVMAFHREEKAWLTVLSAIQHYIIPYGVIKFREKGEITDIIEKPEYTFTINSGVYLLKSECLKFIPDGRCFDMSDLIKSLISNKKKIVTYPVNENDYIDIGRQEEYKNSVEKLQSFI